MSYIVTHKLLNGYVFPDRQAAFEAVSRCYLSPLVMELTEDETTTVLIAGKDEEVCKILPATPPEPMVSLALHGRVEKIDVKADYKDGEIQLTMALPALSYDTRLALQHIAAQPKVSAILHLGCHAKELHDENVHLKHRLRDLKRLHKDLTGVSRAIKETIPEETEDDE